MVDLRLLADRLNWLPVINDAGEVIPPLSPVRWTHLDADGYYHIDLPDDDSGMDEIGISQLGTIPVDGYGQFTLDLPWFVRYKSSGDGGGTPAVGEDWGPKDGLLEITNDRTGYKIKSDPIRVLKDLSAADPETTGFLAVYVTLGSATVEIPECVSLVDVV